MMHAEAHKKTPFSRMHARTCENEIADLSHVVFLRIIVATLSLGANARLVQRLGLELQLVAVHQISVV